MDAWHMLALVLTAFCSALGWWLVNLHNKHEKLREAHEELRVEVAGQFLKKEEIREMFSDFKRDITELIERVTGAGR
jgi:hypothetical protein